VSPGHRSNASPERSRLLRVSLEHAFHRAYAPPQASGGDEFSTGRLRRRSAVGGGTYCRSRPADVPPALSPNRTTADGQPTTRERHEHEETFHAIHHRPREGPRDRARPDRPSVRQGFGHAPRQRRARSRRGHPHGFHRPRRRSRHRRSASRPHRRDLRSGVLRQDHAHAPRDRQRAAGRGHRRLHRRGARARPRVREEARRRHRRAARLPARHR
jgi:hypothetical protein